MITFDELASLLNQSQAGNIPQSLPTEMGVAPSRTYENDILCVDRASMGQDPILTRLGGSYTVANDALTTQRGSTSTFEPTLIVTDSSGSANGTGGTTTYLLLQPVGGTQNVQQESSPAYTYNVYEATIPPIESAVSTYGTFMKDYEEAFEEQTTDPELAMLDVYGTMLAMTPGALNQEAQRGLQSEIPAHPGSEMDDAEKQALIDYFNDYAISNPSPNMKYKNIIYPHNSVAAANSSFKIAEDVFPFFVNLEVNLAPSGDACAALIGSSYADKFTANIAATIENGDIFQRQSFVQQNVEGVRNFNPRVYDANLLAEYDASSFVTNSAVMGSEEDLREAFPESQPTFNDTIEALQYLMDMRNLSAATALNAVDIAMGKKCYSEVVVYRIAKFSQDDSTTPIQNFYLFNSPESSVFNLMDSQVVPGKMYTYKVFSYSFVAATVYEYSNVSDKDTYSIATVRTTAAPKIVENLIFETSAFVTSLPPVSPEVAFRSFIGKEGKIQILFQDSVQRITEQPISLSEEEENRIAKIRESQGILAGAPVRFYNDDETKVYEIYRTSVAPTTVEDFSDSLWRRVTDNAIVDAVQSDKTYYYMFRAIDNHGNVSNPSPAFEVTLIGGVSPYIIANQYEYPSFALSLRSADKGFKKFLRIRPSLQQLMLKQDSLQEKNSSLDVNKVNAGVASQGQLWGKKYKIRIISKETGKKIDFNIKYDYNFYYREQ